MQGYWILRLIGKNNVVLSESGHLAAFNGGAGVGDWFSDNWDEIAKAAASAFTLAGVPIPGGNMGTGLLGALFSGSNDQYMVRSSYLVNFKGKHTGSEAKIKKEIEALKKKYPTLSIDDFSVSFPFGVFLPIPIPTSVLVSGYFDWIEAVYVAQSEDDLKQSTCAPSLFPQSAVLMSENFETHRYELKFRVDPVDWANGTYRFMAGAVDDGWYYNTGVQNELDIGFMVVKTRAIDISRADIGDPAPPPHDAPLMRVTAEIAERAATLNTTLASFGIDLGTPIANSTNRDEHLAWAFGRTLNYIEEELVRKVRILASDNHLFPSVYAALGSQLFRMATATQEAKVTVTAMSLYNGAKQVIEETGSTEDVRNLLIEAIYMACEPVMSHDFANIMTEEAIAQQVFENIAGRNAKRPLAEPRNGYLESTRAIQEHEAV